jgi:hypothetical protein
MPRFSIVGLMGVALVAAMTLAALRSEVWAGVLLMLTLALIGVAVLGVVYQRERDRAWWLGFALFAGSYLALTFGPWFAEPIRPKLATTQLLTYLYQRVNSVPFETLQASLKRMHAQREQLWLRKMQTARFVRNSTDPALLMLERNLSNLDAKINLASSSLAAAAPADRWQAFLPGRANRDLLQNVGHCVFTLLAGLAGALAACRFYAKLQASDAPAAD